MFCKTCGESNKDYSNYCNSDGSSLKNNNRRIKMKKAEVRFCGGCGDKAEATNSYCDNCGTSFFEVNKAVKRIIPSMNSNSSDTSALRNNVNRGGQSLDLGYFDIKSIIKNGSIAFGVVIVISLILSMLINESMRALVLESIGLDYLDSRQMLSKLRIVNLFDIALLSNQANLELSGEAVGLISGTMNLKGGVHMLMMIPALIFIVMGFIRARLDSRYGEQFNLMDIVGSSVVYTLLLTIVSIINKKSISQQIMYGYSIDLNKKFSILSILFAGVFISIVFTFVGYALYGKLKKRHDLFGGFSPLLEGSFNFTVLLTLMPIIIVTILGIYSGSYSSQIYSMTSLLMVLLISPFAYLVMNFGVLNIYSYDYGYSTSINERISLFGLGPIKEWIDYSMGKSSIYIFMALIIVALVLFLSGRSMAKRFGLDIKNILYSSLSYSVIATLFSFIIRMSINVTGNMPLFNLEDLGNGILSFNFFSVLFGTFIMSALFMFLGSKFSGEHK